MTDIAVDSRLRLNYSLLLHETAQGLALWVADRESVTVGGDFSPLLDVLALIDSTRTLADIRRELANSRTADIVDEILAFGLDHNLIQPVGGRESRLDEPSLEKWDRQINNFTILDGVTDDDAITYQERLADSHVLVLGVGGVGGYLAASCAMTGIGRLTLVDFDTVELSNTSRQILYSEADIGRSKLSAAAADLLARNPRVRLHAIERQASDAETMASILDESVSRLGDIDLVLLAADHPRQTLPYLLDDSCQCRGIPFLMMAPHDFSRVSIGPLIIPGRTGSYSDYFPRDLAVVRDKRVHIINNRFVANIMDPYNGLVAKMAMVEVVKFLTEYRVSSVVGKMLDLDTATWSITEFDLER